MTMRVNLIHSKLYFFFKKYTKTKHTEKKKTIHSNSASELHCWRAQCMLTQNFKKQAGAASPNSRAKHEFAWIPPKLNCVFEVTKHHVCCGCFKRRSNHANKRPLIHYPLFIGPDKSDLAQNDGVGFGPIHFVF